MSRTRRRAISVLVLPAVGLVVSLAAGCGPTEVGAAAVVGDNRISVMDLQDEVEAYTSSLPESPDASGDVTTLQQTILQRMVHHDLFVALADRNDVDVTGAQIDAFLEQLAAQQGGDLGAFLAQSGFTKDSVRPAVYDELVRQQLTNDLGGDDALADAIKKVGEELGVTVNPRYGEWDGLQIQATSGSLSEPVTPTKE